MSPSLSQFFEQYREAWNALDAKRIAEHYAVPSAITDREGPQVYTAFDALVAKFQRACEVLRDRGFEDCAFTVALHHPLGSNAAAVDLDWQIRASSGPLTFLTLYVCHDASAGWRIFAAHAYLGAGDT